MSPAPTNRYCERLGVPVPCLADHVTGRTARPIGGGPAKPFELLVLAILEHGAPLRLEDAAARLEAAGFRSRAGNATLSLKRSWAGRPPVVRGPGDTLDLDLRSHDLDLMLFVVGLRPPRARLHAAPGPEGRARTAEPSDEDSLSHDDLELALGSDGAPQWAPSLRAAALLDALGSERMDLDAVNAALARLDPGHQPLTRALGSRWRTVAVRLDDEGRVCLDRDHAALRKARRCVRVAARRARDARATQEDSERWERQDAIRQRHERDAWARMRRCVVRVVPDLERPEAGAVVSFPPGGGHDTVTVFPPGELADLTAHVAEHDVVVALDPRATLRALGLDPHDFRVIDLETFPQAALVEGRRDPVKLTLQRFVKASAAVRLAEGPKLRALLDSGTGEALTRQLARDAWSLTSLYRNGVLHPGLALTSGMRTLLIPVDWTLPGEPNVVELAEQAGVEGREVEIRALCAPTAHDPWSRCTRGFVHALGPGGVSLGTPDGEKTIPWRVIRDLRFTGRRDE